MNILYTETPIGRLAIAGTDDAITHLFFETDAVAIKAEPRETALLLEAARQLDAYLAGSLREFALPLAPKGSPFLLKVWDLLRAVPYGQTASYGEIAARAGNPGAARAVGLANNRNPIPIFIPCHRIVGSSGRLTGYRGGLDLKKRLLELEGIGHVAT